MTEENIMEMVAKLKILSSIIEKNSYIRDTSNKLKQLLEDAESSYRILFIGNESEEKNSLINALIGRKLLSEKNDAYVHIFIRYGEKEFIRAVFVDGTVADFEMKHLYLFTEKNTYIGEILKTYINYIEIYLSCDLLKNVILMNAISLENVAKSFIERADEVFWVLGGGARIGDDELKLMKRIYHHGIKPYMIINMTEYNEEQLLQSIQKGKERYGQFVKEFVGVSSKQALQSKNSHQMQLYIDSHMHDLTNKINQLSIEKNNRERITAVRLKQWMELLDGEVKQIPEREPFKSAQNRLKEYADFEHSIGRTLFEKNVRILTDYEKEYAHVSQVLKDVKTLYQLLKVIEFEPYLQDENVDVFVALALKYLEKVREYRTLHTEYVLEQQQFEKLEKKLLRNKMNPLVQDHTKDEELLLSKAEKLNQMQRKCKEAYNAIKRIELDLLNDLYTIQRIINELTKQQLEKILKKALYLKVIHNKELKNIENYVHKLKEFECIFEMQKFLQTEMKEFFEKAPSAFSGDEKMQILTMIDHISQVQLLEEGFLSNLSLESLRQDFAITVDFKEKYAFAPLQLTETDIISEIPSIPLPVDIKHILDFEKP